MSKGWIGERFDADAGLQYLNARYYDPDLAMFIQPDWWEVTQAGVGTNRYAYAGGDPVNMSDANGNFVSIVIAIAVGVSYLIGAEAANAPGAGDATVPSGEGAKRMVGAAVSVGAAGPSAVRLGIACVTNPACASEAVSAIGAAEEVEAVAAGVDAAATEEGSIASTAASKTRQEALDNAKELRPADEAGEIFGWGKKMGGANDALDSLTKEKVLAMKAKTTKDAVRACGEAYWHAIEDQRGGGADPSVGVAGQRLNLMQKILDLWDK